MATTTSRIGPADHGQPMTLEEFIDAETEGGWLYELAQGVIDVTEVPAPSHGRIVLRLARLFMHYDDDHPEVIKYQAGGGDCRIGLAGMQSERHPNQAVYLDSEPTGPRPWARWVPHIVVEIVSNRGEARDNIKKREENLRFGVAEYWILDPALRRLLMLQRAGDVWHEVIVPEDGRYRTRFLPGLEVLPLESLGPVEVNDDENEE